MKKLITISLAIILIMAFCFVNVPQNIAKAEMPNLGSVKTVIQNFFDGHKTLPAKSSANDVKYIAADETWSGTHHVTEDVVVNGSSTLTIEPGTQVLFDGDFSINVAGNLVAIGTASAPITFTSDIATNYAGISSGPDGGAITLNYCNIDYAGSATSSDLGILVDGPASITNCNFTHGSSGDHSGNVMIMDGSNITIADNNFDSSTEMGVASMGGSNVTISGNTFQNSLLGISTVGDATINDNQFNLGAEGQAAIGVAGGQVTIDGNTIGADSVVGIYISSLFQSCNATITHNDVSGVLVGIGLANGDTEEATATINFNNISGNIVGVSVMDQEGSSPDATVQYNDITGNTGYGIEVISVGPQGEIAPMDSHIASLPVLATKNYWGSATGPTHASNPSGTGDAVTDNVTFSPWLDSSFTTPPPINSINLTDGQTIGGIYPIIVDASWVVHGLPLDDMTKVDFYIDGVLHVTDTAVPYTYDWDTTVHASPHTVRVVATNVLGTTNERTVNVEVVNELPYTGK